MFNKAKSKRVKTVILQNIIALTVFYFDIFKNGIYSCHGKAEFSAAITLVLNKKTFSINNPVGKGCAA